MTALEQWWRIRKPDRGGTIWTDEDPAPRIDAGRAPAWEGSTIDGPFVLASEGCVEAEREWCERILDVDQRDEGDGFLLAALANHASVRLRELGGQSARVFTGPGHLEQTGYTTPADDMAGASPRTDQTKEDR